MLTSVVSSSCTDSHIEPPLSWSPQWEPMMLDGGADVAIHGKTLIARHSFTVDAAPPVDFGPVHRG